MHPKWQGMGTKCVGMLNHIFSSRTSRKRLISTMQRWEKIRLSLIDSDDEPEGYSTSRYILEKSAGSGML
jgi:hypothetical protein